MRRRREGAGKPAIVVLGGPNGAGKTTLAMGLLTKLGIYEFVNADLIARGLSPLSHEGAALQAGRLMLSKMRDLAGALKSFAFETTLASRSFATFLREQQRRGYTVHVLYVWLSSENLAVTRVHERVERGGHGIEDDVVRRRYHRGLANLFDLYLPLADFWILFDNSGSSPIRVAKGGKDRRIKVYAAQTYRQVKAAHHHDP
ncbi:MAG: AAA family ATPase [Planctomycetes bacterium]|nr:AAA family ATPase [Planctomycetota bacterium]